MSVVASATPFDKDAERAVLGAVFVNPDVLPELADQLRPGDFYADAHTRIYRAMLALAAEHKPVDLIVVKDRLAQRGELDAVGLPYLFRLPDGVPLSTNARAYADVVMAHARRRRLQAAAGRILQETQDLTVDTRDVLDNAERAFFAITDDERQGTDVIDAHQLVAEGIPQIEKLLETKQGVTGVPSGFADLDDMTRGFQPGALILVAARPAMGKSAFAANVGLYAAMHGSSVALFSLEMGRGELFNRFVAAHANIDSHRLQIGCLHDAELGRMGHAFAAIGASRLHVDDSPTLSALSLRGKARRLKARDGLNLVIVDYLQLMQLPRTENRNLAIAEVSRSLKLLARELNIPIIALSQLSRESERRDGKRPVLSDLRDSGALEQDADVVLFIHRPEVYERTPDNAGLAEIIIAKHRNGRTGKVKLRWNRESTRFDNLTETRAC